MNRGNLKTGWLSAVIAQIFQAQMTNKRLCCEVVWGIKNIEASWLFLSQFWSLLKRRYFSGNCGSTAVDKKSLVQWKQ
jgi:hypothetical protein